MKNLTTKIANFLKQNWVNLIVFILCFFGGVVLFSAYWIAKHFEVKDFGVLLFHLRFPLLGNGVPLVGSYLLNVVFVSFIIAFCLAWMRQSARLLAVLYGYMVMIFDKISTFKFNILKVFLSLILFALCINITINKFRIKDYLRTQTQYSQLYEKHYKSFDLANIKDFTPKQNLIIILVESLESNLTNHIAISPKTGGGDAPLNLIPHLQKIATENTNFSFNGGFGGIEQVFGARGTVNGLVGYLCAIPLNIPITMSNKYFLSSTTCISDILKDLGYKQSFVAGTDFSFAGKRNFLQSHNIEVMDLKYFQKKGVLPKKLPKDMEGVWSLKDAKMFELAKDYLEQQNDSNPFALYILTVDTHGPQGFVDKEHCPNLDNSYESAYLCTDKIVSDFVDYIKHSRFKDNTTIVILGDHLSIAHFIKPHSTRNVFNAFINAKFTKQSLNATKNRKLSHFDIAPLILDSIGLRVESFGLGRNPFYQKSLIEGAYNIDSFNDELKLRNKIYDRLWDTQ